MPRVNPSSGTATKLEKSVEVEKLENLPNRQNKWIIQYILTEANLALLYFLLSVYTPAHHLFQVVFWGHILSALINLFTSMIKWKSFLVVRSYCSGFHFICFIYATTVIPIWLAIIAMPQTECNPVLHFCVPIKDSSEYQTKIYVGMAAQAVFGLFLFAKMKILRLLTDFHFVEPIVKLQWTVYGSIPWPGNLQPYEYVNEVLIKPEPVNHDDQETSL